MGDLLDGDFKFFLATPIGMMEFHPVPQTLNMTDGDGDSIVLIPMETSFSCSLYLNRMSGKRFKKRMMALCLPRDAAEKMVKSVKRWHGLVPYSLVWIRMVAGAEAEFRRWM